MNNLPDIIQPSAPPQSEVLQPYAQNYQLLDMSFFSPQQPNTLNVAGQGFNNFVSGPASKDVKFGAKSFDWKRSNADRYVGSDYYNELGFDPEKDNESLYGYRQTWGNTLGNAIGGAWKLGVNGFVDGWKGWGRMGDALMHMDWSKLAGDEESLRELNDTQNSVMNKYAIYATPESEEGFWNRKTFGNFLQQSGFTLGTIAQMATEQVLTKVIEGLIAIPTGGVGSAALETAADAKALNTLRGLTRAITIEKAAKDLNAIGSIWKDRKGIENLFSVIGGKIPGAGIVTDMKLAKNMGASSKTIAMIGIGGVKRGLSELNLATTEARMEAAGTYGNMYDQLYYDHLDRTGELPMGKDLEAISKAAYSAGKDNFVFNAALLSAMNRIQFDNMFKSFKMGSKFGGIFANEEEAAAAKLLKVSGKAGDKELTQFYRKGTFGTMGVVGKIAKDFGRGKAAIELGKPLLKHISKWEFTEGLQELLQNSSNEYYTEYYKDLYHGKTPDSSELIENSLDKQLSMEGLKTFMSGALTGMITSGPSKLIQKGFERLGTTKKERQDRNTALDGFVTEQNGFLRSPANYLSEITKNFNIQTEGSEALDKALKNKDKFAFENIRTTMLGALAARAVRMGTHEAMLDTFKDYGKHMTKEEFEQAFVGFGYDSKNKSTAGEYVNRIADTVESYVEHYKLLHENLDNKINPDVFPKNSTQYKEAQFAKQAQDSVIEILAGNALKAQDSLKRMTEIHNKATSNKAMGASLADTFTVMGSEEHTKNEISMLKQEIKSMDQAQGMDRESIQILKVKKEQLEALEKFKEHRTKLYEAEEVEDGKVEVREQGTGKKKGTLHSTYKTMEEADKAVDKLHEDSVKELYDGFKTFVSSKNQAAGITHPITNTEYDEHFGALNDYIRLNKKAQQHTDAYNLLINPKNFSKLHERLMNGARSAAIQGQLDSLNRILGMRGFIAANPDLVKKIKALDAKTDKTEEDIAEYYKLLEEITLKAANYTEADNKAYMAKIQDIVMNNEEFADQNEKLIAELNKIAIKLENLDKTTDEAKELDTKFNNILNILYDKAEEYLAQHGEETKGDVNTGINGDKKEVGTPARTSKKGTQAEGTVKGSKADVESRRETTFKSFYLETTGSQVYEYYINPNGETEEIYGTSEQDVKDKINAKYDAELAGLNQAPEVTEDPAVTRQKEIESIINEQIAEINKATTPKELIDLREGLAEAITQNPNSPLAQLDTKGLQRIVEAINKRIEELPTFVKLENYNVIQYKDGDKEYTYQVTGNPGTNSVDVREYPNGSQTTYKLTADQINKNTVNVYKNGADFTLASKAPVTPQDQQTAAETKDTSKDFFADGGAITKAIAQADDTSLGDLKNELLATIGCE